jgi:hypothetical protein
LANPFSNKKKIRNWRRQILKVKKWEEAHTELDIDSLLSRNVSYVKIWIDPWYRLTRRNPPIWLCRIMFNSLCNIYCSWRKQLDTLNEPYYLKIWIFDPHFINSQVVVATKEKIDDYNRCFNPSDKLNDIPRNKYDINDRFDEFEWEQFLDEDFYFKTFDDLSEQDIKELSKKAHTVEEVTFENGKTSDICYRVRKGNCWVGSVK